MFFCGPGAALCGHLACQGRGMKIKLCFYCRCAVRSPLGTSQVKLRLFGWLHGRAHHALMSLFSGTRCMQLNFSIFDQSHGRETKWWRLKERVVTTQQDMEGVIYVGTSKQV